MARSSVARAPRCGEIDIFGREREGGEALRAYAGEGQCHRVEALDAGHYVHHEQHTRINEVTRAFLTECGRMTP